MYLWGVAILELDSHPDHNKGPDQRTMRSSKEHPIDPSHTTYHTTNRLIARIMSGSPNYA